MKYQQPVPMPLLTLIILMLASTIAYSQSWKNLITSGSIPARSNSSGIYDSLNNRIVIFGGLSAEGPTNTVYCLDLYTSQWTLLFTKSVDIPAPRFSHNSLYDALNNRMLIWSGQGAVLYNDVWALNFSDSTWVNLSINGNAMGRPLQRYGTAAIFDPISHHLINFAGFTTDGRFGDTWSFHTDSLIWTEINSAISPLKRCLHTSAYSYNERKMYIFGGQSTGNLNDLWVLNLRNYKWQALQTNLMPSARHFTSLISIGDRLLLFGGNTSSQGNHSGGLNDLWQFRFSNQQWEQVSEDIIKPGARSGHTAVYDSRSRSMVVVGGHKTDGSILNDVWTFGPLLEETTPVIAGVINRNIIDIHPNPFHDVLNIDMTLFQSPVTISLYNFEGEKLIFFILDQNIAGIETINTELLIPGLYHLVVQDEKASYSKQIIKY